ncbi:MAG: CotH kinase family protein [Clostridiales bacterium]|nr:CotH kinase family protein [Clostridiales bacterium]
MIRSKKTEAAAVLAMVLALLLSLHLPSFAQAMGGVRQQYEGNLFGTELVTVDIQMDADDWQEMLDNAINEEYYVCDVVINGQTFSNVGIRPKGNTSLSQVASSDSDRFSFKIEFDHYQDGQTCWGLDKLVLNNLMSDAAYIKEYLVYDMFDFLDMPASEYAMAQVSVNGTDWGVYLTLEGVEESFLTRNFGSAAGDLYKPESMGGGGPGGMKGKDPAEVRRMMGFEDEAGKMAETTDDTTDATTQAMPDFAGQPPEFDGQMPDFDSQPPQMGEMPDGQTAPADMHQRPDRMNGGMGGGNGADLVYSDDDPGSYSTIWEGAVTDTNDTDHERVVAALKKISAGDLSGLDVDLMARYMAVQTFVVNLDSLSGNMAHNYYLYEKDGRVTLLPWDYNLAFGGFMSGSASATINFPIDTPVLGVTLEDRPIFAAILNDEDACARYHDYLRQLCEEYVGGGRFAIAYQQLRNLLDGRAGSDTQTDPTGFYTSDEYEQAVTLLKTVVEKRAESILGQLDGTIPSTTDGQQADPDALVDTSGIDLTILGTQGDGGHGGGFPGGDCGNMQPPTDGAAAPEQTGQQPADGIRQGEKPDKTAKAGA